MKPETATRATLVEKTIELIMRETKRIVCAESRKKVIIYGAGARGVVLHEALKMLGVAVEYFLDSSPSKQRSTVCGRPVYEPMKVMYEKSDDILVIVAAADPKQQIAALESFGLERVTNIRHIFDSEHIGDGIARVAGMPLIDFFLGYNRISDLPGFTIENMSATGDRPLRIVTLGGSTTDPEVIDPVEWKAPDGRDKGLGSWPRILHEILNKNGIHNCIYNGGFSSYISGQELMKLLRDVLTLKPDIVISYDGINDAQSCLRYNSSHSKYHAYFKNLEAGINPLFSQSNIAAFGGQEAAPFVTGVSYGVAHDVSAVEEWHNNQRAMHAICREFGIHYYCFLQPGGLLLDEYVQSCDVNLRTHWFLYNFFVTMAETVVGEATTAYDPTSTHWLNDLLAAHLSHKPAHVEGFYRVARTYAQQSDFIIDMVDTMNGYPDVFYDSVHCTSKGNRLIAERIYREMACNGVLMPAKGRIEGV